MDSFTRAPVHSGTNLIKTVQRETTPLEAGFMTWNRIRILKASNAPSGFSEIGLRDPMFHIVLNQAFHTGWHSTSCTVERGAEDNLVASCPAKELDAGPVDLVFSDPVSQLGARVSLTAGPVSGISIGLLTLGLVSRRRPIAAPSLVR
jgi:hypothetical protein